MFQVCLDLPLKKRIIKLECLAFSMIVNMTNISKVSHYDPIGRNTPAYLMLGSAYDVA